MLRPFQMSLTQRILLSALALSVWLAAPAAAETAPATGSPEFRRMAHDAFQVGERLEFSVRFMGLSCGSLSMLVADTAMHEGREVYIVRVHAMTNSFFSRIYHVSDTLTSYIDREGLFSWYYEKDIDEKKVKKVERFRYDQRALRWTKNGEDMGDILPYTQDLVSSVYHLRSKGWDDTDVISAPLNDTRKNYEMIFTLGKDKRIRTPFGREICRAGSPMLHLDDKFKQIGANEVWFTDDDQRIPVLIKSKILLGSFYAKLVAYDPGGDVATRQRLLDARRRNAAHPADNDDGDE